MYRVNLYREYFVRRRSLRGRAARTALLAGLLTAEVILVGLLTVSALLLTEHARSLRGEISRRSVVVSADTLTTRQLETARALVKIKAGRIVWSPKLSALAGQIDPSISLDQVVGQSAQRAQRARLSTVGIIRDQAAGMAPVSAFIDKLRGDPRITEDFPRIHLETIEGGGASHVQVICETAGSGS